MIIQSRNFGSSGVIRCGVHESTHNYGSHIHQHSELVYVLEGSIESTVDGKTDVATAGQMVILTPLRVHSTYTPERCKIFICVFSNDFVSDLIPSNELYGGYENTVFTPSETLRKYVEDSFIKSATTYRHDNVISKRTVHAGLHLIMAEYTSVAVQSKTKQTANALANIIMYMSRNFKEQLTLSSVGKALGYSSGYISHCMENMSGMNFTAILNSFRVEHAKNMLLSSENYTNIEIALESGFTCERSFYRAFLRAVGMTPREYVEKRSK